MGVYFYLFCLGSIALPRGERFSINFGRVSYLQVIFCFLSFFLLHLLFGWYSVLLFYPLCLLIFISTYKVFISLCCILGSNLIYILIFILLCPTFNLFMEILISLSVFLFCVLFYFYIIAFSYLFILHLLTLCLSTRSWGSCSKVSQTTQICCQQFGG